MAMKSVPHIESDLCVSSLGDRTSNQEPHVIVNFHGKKYKWATLFSVFDLHVNYYHLAVT